MEQDLSEINIYPFFIPGNYMLCVLVMFEFLGGFLALGALMYYWKEIKSRFFGENLKAKTKNQKKRAKKKKKKRAKKRSNADLDGKRTGPVTAHGQ